MSQATLSLPSFPHRCPSPSSTSFLRRTSFTPLRPRRSNESRRRKGGYLSCKCLFGLGIPELVVIAGVAALLFGPKQLPEVGRSIGKTIKSFQQAAKEFESELKKDPETPGDAIDAKPMAVGEQEKNDAKVSSSKEI
ncbi:Sec-independent protein translocase protein TATA, chloroplastic-like protein [Drosera capensis]